MSDANRAQSIQEITDSFVQRLRQGERPSIREYKERYPQFANEIDDVFPALEMLEQCEPDGTEELAVDDSIPAELGEYQILQEVGRGGMGIVFEAMHTTMRRRVALKVLPKSSSRKPMHLSRFHREARAAGQLHHSNIVPVFEVGEARGLHYYAMQFIHGENLDLVIEEIKRLRASSDPSHATGLDSARPSQLPLSRPAERQCTTDRADMSGSVALCMLNGRYVAASVEGSSALKPDDRLDSGAVSDLPTRSTRSNSAEPSSGNPSALSDSVFSSSGISSGGGGERGGYFRRVAAVGAQVADALEYAHQHGVLHRDIKPANLILDTEGTVWVTDFGLAKHDDDGLTRTGDIVGTLRYMSPERFGGTTDRRSDIYSLGLTLYELCTLQHAFPQADRPKLAHQVAQRTPVAPRKLDPYIPRDFETIMLKAIDPEPDRRYATAKRFAEDLRLFLADRPIAARRISAAERVWRVCRRNPVLSAMAGCIAMLILLVGAGSLWFAGHSSRQAAVLRVETDRARAAEAAATAANSRSRNSLYRAYVAQAKLGRQSAMQGRRQSTLASIQGATTLLNELGLSQGQLAEQRFVLRNEAIATLALIDVEPIRRWEANEPRDFSPDYRHYCHIDEAGNICIRRTDTGERSSQIAPPGESVWLMQLSASGRYIACKHHVAGAQSQDHIMQVWDSTEPNDSTVISKGTLGFAFSPDERLLAYTLLDPAIEVFSLEHRQVVKRIPLEFQALHVEWSQTGVQMAVTEDHGPRLQIWSVSEEPEMIAETEIAAKIKCLSWRSDPFVLAVGATNGNVYSWRGDLSAEPRVARVHRNSITNLHVHPHRNLTISSAWDDTTRIINLDSGLQLLRMNGCQLRSTGFASDGATIAVSDSAGCGLWQLADSSLNVLPSMEGLGAYVSFHPSNPRVIARSDEHRTEFWDVENGTHLQSWELPGNQIIGFGPGDHLFASGAKGLTKSQIHVQEVQDDGTLEIAVGKPTTLVEAPTRHFDVAAPGDRVAVAVGSSALLVDARSGKVLTKFGEHPALSRIQLTGDGQQLITGTWHGTGVRVWSTTTGELLRDLGEGMPSTTVAVGPLVDGPIATLSEGKLQLWNPQTWKSVDGVAARLGCFSADGDLLAVAPSVYTGGLLDPGSGSVLAVLEAPDGGRVINFAFSPDASRLAMILDDGRVHIWQIDELVSQLSALELSWR